MVKLVVCKIVNLKFRLNKVYEYSLKKTGKKIVGGLVDRNEIVEMHFFRWNLLG